MSLSKYYKSSDSFQPEKIVKHRDPEQQHWTRTRVSADPAGHQADPIGAGTSPGKVLETILEQSGDDSEQVGTIAVHETATGSSINLERTGSAGIDPGNYMETAVAEARIEEAYQRGLQQGLADAEEDYGDAQRALLSACQQLDTIRETLIQNSRNEVLEFAMAIAERIVRISVREQDRTIIATIDEALQQAVKSDEFTIYLHPKDYETVSLKREELIAGLSGLNNIVIKQDNSIERGGTKIESDNCTIDGTIATQFDVIREELNRKL
jgi:flagellar assembly protein FliH